MAHPVTQARQDVAELRAEIAELRKQLPEPSPDVVIIAGRAKHTIGPNGTHSVQQIMPEPVSLPTDPPDARRDVTGILRTIDGRPWRPAETEKERRARRNAEAEAQAAAHDAEWAERRAGLRGGAYRDDFGCIRDFQGRLLEMADGAIVPSRVNAFNTLQNHSPRAYTPDAPVQVPELDPAPTLTRHPVIPAEAESGL